MGFKAQQDVPNVFEEINFSEDGDRDGDGDRDRDRDRDKDTRFVFDLLPGFATCTHRAIRFGLGVFHSVFNKTRVDT